MKQLPRISNTLLCQPWCILPDVLNDLVTSYRNYLTGDLPAMLSGSGSPSFGIDYEVNDDNSLALIHLDGVIVKRAPNMMCGPKMIDLSEFDRLLIDVAQDDRIKTLVLNMDTPGGCGIGLAETTSYLADVRASGTRIVAYTDYLCASAGYWLAACADEIIAAPSAQVGGVGTYVAALDESEAWAKAGIKLKLFKDGDYKAMGHPGKAWTPEEEAFLQSRLTTWASNFKNHVRTCRPGIEETTMQGQSFDAKSAPRGLVDSLSRSLADVLLVELEALLSA